jgi:hydrogenase assembly chaperone HypC/HupF
MCLAYPVQVIAVEPGQTAMVAWRGGWQRVTLLATADTVVIPGDWLLVQSGIALCRLEPEEAAQRRRLLDHVEGGPA